MWFVRMIRVSTMKGLPFASRRLAACLGVIWFTSITSCIKSVAFSVGQQQQCVWARSLLATHVADCVSGLHKTGSDLRHSGSKAPTKVLERNAAMSPVRLSAEADTGGEIGGQILLAERSVNRVTLIGRVGLDPEIRHLPSGDRMASFSLATSEQWRDKTSGEVRSRTEWHRVVIFDKGLVDLVEAFVHKGRRLYVDGSLQTRRWVTSDGQERFTTEVLLSKYKGELVLLESPEEKHGRASAGRAAPVDGMTLLGGASQGVRNAAVASGNFGSQQQSNDGTASSNATAPFRSTTSWR